VVDHPQQVINQQSALPFPKIHTRRKQQQLNTVFNHKERKGGDGAYPFHAAQTLEGQQQIFSLKIHLSMKLG